MQSIQLLDLAERSGAPMAELARRIGLNGNALSVARNNGRLSPAMAALLAAELDQDVGKWTLCALAENARNAPMRRRLAALANASKSWITRAWNSATFGRRRRSEDRT